MTVMTAQDQTPDATGTFSRVLTKIMRAVLGGHRRGAGAATGVLTHEKAYRVLRQVLAAAQAERHHRAGIVHGADGRVEVEWVQHERAQMLASVNHLRVQAGLPRVKVADVKAAERRAQGHADYTPKFALYCADLAVEV